MNRSPIKDEDDKAGCLEHFAALIGAGFFCWLVIYAVAQLLAQRGGH